MTIKLEDVQSALFDAYVVRDNASMGGGWQGIEKLREKMYNLIRFLEELEIALTEGEVK